MDEIRGIDLAERYYWQVAWPHMQERCPAYLPRVAAGLAGDGSECFGFDDEISRDHDWGPGFCLWLTQADYTAFGTELSRILQELPQGWGGYAARSASAWGGGRLGVFAVNQFYQRFIALPHAPRSLTEWRVLPEVNLATATNGRIFVDPVGEFSAYRAHLLTFYPEDVRLKKVAARCMTIAQAGQYNYPRCVARREYVAALCAEAEWIKAAGSLVFLLNKRYQPYYKWLHRAIRELPVLGERCFQVFASLAVMHEQEQGDTLYQRKGEVIEAFCQELIGELAKQNLSELASDYLLDHGPVVQSRIKDEQIRSLNVWID
ncbi:MAG: DUF4037 domain-containing protein [Peptococcaceae bacterium]|jgi:hypothetical protein|nr:DUF4037 domain-containing protein [Peptococcaceae bacterium]